MKTLEKDVLLICKGWYDDSKYSNTLKALQGYYDENYCGDYIVDKKFALELFLKPTIIEMSKHFHTIIHDLFSKSTMEFNVEYSREFDNIMYDRCVTALVQTRTLDVIDFSDYKEMFDEIKKRRSELN